jgi:S-methylmethionine transporter
LYFGLPFIAWCYLAYWLTCKYRSRRTAPLEIVAPGSEAA